METKNEIIIGEYLVVEDIKGSFYVRKTYSNTKGALREIAEKTGFEYDENWNTRQFGAKLIGELKGEKNTLKRNCPCRIRPLRNLSHRRRIHRRLHRLREHQTRPTRNRRAYRPRLRYKSDHSPIRHAYNQTRSGNQQKQKRIRITTSHQQLKSKNYGRI